jgi:hypothetical protein
MAINIKKILRGLGLVPKNPADSDYTPLSQAGEMEVKTTDNKLNYHNGSSASPVVTEAHSATLTNKNLSDSTVAIADVSDSTKQIKFDAAGSTNTSTTILSSQTTNQTITLPNATDTLVGKATTDSLTNKTLIDSSTAIADVSDNTKQIKFDAAGSTGTSTTLLSSQTTNKTLTLPDANDTLVGKDTTDILTNKTLSGNTATNLVNGSGTVNINSSGTVTLPNATDTLVGKATTDTLSNKTLVDNSTAIADASDPTKQIKFDAAGSASTSTTLTSSQTANRILTLPDATTTIVGTDVAQSLSNKTFLDAITGTQIATPTNPSAGSNKLYFKSDGNLYKLDNLGNETQVGAGGGGATTLSVTAGENLSARDAVYIASSSDTGRTSGRAYKLDVTNDQRAEFLGFATGAAITGGAVTVQIAGTLTGFSGLPTGKPIFGSTTTPGSYQTSAPTLSGQSIIQLGEAVSSTDIAINAAGSATAIRVVSNTLSSSTIPYNKNYVLNGDFESNTANSWSLFNTTLTNKIPTGSIVSGAASLNTLSATASGKLAGAYSLSVTSPGAVTAGHGFISDAFSIDAEDQAKVLSFSFAYQAVSGTMNFSGTSSNTFAVYIYDVSGSAWIQPAGVYNLVQGSGAGIATGTFQTTATGTQYRIAVVCVTATSGAISMLFDDFVVSPQKQVMAPAMSDWQSYTPTFVNLGTVTGIDFRYRRVGDTIEIQGQFIGGVPVASTASFTMPNGWTSGGNDKLPGAGAFQVVGARTFGAGGQGDDLLVLAQTNNNNLFFGVFSVAFNGYDARNGDQVSANGSKTVLNAKVPITGWSSNTVSSADTDTRVVAYRSNATPTSAAFNNSANLIFGTSSFDFSSSYNTSTGEYTAPVSGVYSFLGQVGITGSSAGSFLDLYMQVDGSNVAIFNPDNLTTGEQFVAISTEFKLNAGQIVRFRWGTDKSTPSVSGGSTKNHLSISRLSGPAVVQASESVSASYYMATGANPGANNQINFDGKLFDTHSAVTTGASWKFTAPVSGIYSISGVIGSAGNPMNWLLYKGGSSYCYVGSNITGQGPSYRTPINSPNIRLNAGEYIDIRPDASGSITASASTPYSTVISITRVGN